MASAADPTAADLPKNIRVAIQFVEVPHPLLTELMAGPDTRGNILHEQVMARVAKGEAKIIESCLVVAKHAEKARLATIREVIYPLEYGVASPPSFLGGISHEGQTFPRCPMFYPPVPSAWDTRNTGVTLEVEPSVTYDAIVHLRVLSEIVTPVRMDTWTEFLTPWGDASFRMPVFRTLRLDTSLSLVPGRFDLAGVLTPKPAEPVPAVQQKVLVFVRADVITLRPNP